MLLHTCSLYWGRTRFIWLYTRINLIAIVCTCLPSIVHTYSHVYTFRILFTPTSPPSLITSQSYRCRPPTGMNYDDMKRSGLNNVSPVPRELSFPVPKGRKWSDLYDYIMLVGWPRSPYANYSLIIKLLSHRKSRPNFHRYRTDFLSLYVTPLPIYHLYIIDIVTISLFIIWRYL